MSVIESCRVENTAFYFNESVSASLTCTEPTFCNNFSCIQKASGTDSFITVLTFDLKLFCRKADVSKPG